MSISISNQLLLDYKTKGFLFHGSTNPDITILEPRTAIDTDSSNTFNNDTAIFASPLPEASVIFACMSRDHIPGDLRYGTWIVSQGKGGKIHAEIPQLWQPYLYDNTGYVYVLNNIHFSDFGTNSWQVKSNQASTPITKIAVTFADFEQLGGQIHWIKSSL